MRRCDGALAEPDAAMAAATTERAVRPLLRGDTGAGSGTRVAASRSMAEPQHLPVPPAQPGPWWRTAALGGAALALALGALALTWLLARPLALLFAAIVVAETLQPLVGWLARRMPRTVGVILVYTAALAAFVVMAAIVAPPLVRQVEEAIAAAPRWVDRGRELLARSALPGADRVFDFAARHVGAMGSVAIRWPLVIARGAVEIVFVVFLSMYWLIASPALGSLLLSLFREERRSRVTEVLRKVGHTTGGYLRGSILNGAIVGTLVFVGLHVLRVAYPLPLAVVAGVLEIFPVIGPVIAAIPILATALAGGATKALLTLAFLIAMQQAENHLLVPNIMRTQTDLPPALVAFALFSGGMLGGILGALVAIPLSGALKVLFTEVAVPAIRRWTGASRPVPPPTA